MVCVEVPFERAWSDLIERVVMVLELRVVAELHVVAELGIVAVAMELDIAAVVMVVMHVAVELQVAVELKVVVVSHAVLVLRAAVNHCAVRCEMLLCLKVRMMVGHQSHSLLEHCLYHRESDEEHDDQR